MTFSEFLIQLDDVIEAPHGTIKKTGRLADIPAWDSLAVLSFIAMVDSKFGKQLSGKDIAACETVADLAKLAGVENS